MTDNRRGVPNVGEESVERPRDPHTSGHTQPVDAGRTSGGGSLGHEQPPDFERAAPTRNTPPPDEHEG